MRKSTPLFLLILNAFFVISCAQDKKKNNSNANVSKSAINTKESFEIAMGAVFYMTGDAINDLYIDATVTKGTLKENTVVELVKKSNPTERVSATIYRIDDNNFQPVKTASSGQKVTLNLKIDNDKNLRFSNNGNEYAMVAKGSQVQALAAQKSKGNATITINGKPWSYEGYKIYHYTKDNGIHKNPANILITFYKANANVKMTGGEERLQVSLFHAPKSAKSFTNADMDVAFWTNMFGQETAYAKTLNNNSLSANAKVVKYESNTSNASLSGTIQSVAKGSMCNGCPNINIVIDFENLEVELYNN